MNTEPTTAELLDAELEARITESIAQTSNFTIRAKDAKCNECGRRLMKNYAGQALNERMLQHRAGHLRPRYVIARS